MATSSTQEVRAGIAKLTAEQKKKLAIESAATEWTGKCLSDENLQAELIEKHYNALSVSMSFDDWVQMKFPTLDKRE
jgi:hypothetical protein